MSPALRSAYTAEMEKAIRARECGNLDVAFVHLERAHILGQSFTLPHVRTHLAMLAVGWQRRDTREILGQLSRIIASVLFTRIWVPVGNTGGANVGAMRPMPLPADLRALLETEMVPPSRQDRPSQ